MKSEAGGAKLFVCLIEYHPLAARQLEQIVARQPELQLVSWAELQAAKHGSKLHASVFVVDRGTLPTPLSHLLRFLGLRFRTARTLALDQPRPPEEIFRLLFLGIHGFLSYGDVDGQLLPAVRALDRGHLWVAPEVLEQFVRYTALLGPRKGAARDDLLTRRERHVLELLRRRLSNKEIGAILRISTATVKFHLANIFSKLGVSDRHEVIELLASRRFPALLAARNKPAH